MTPTRVPKDPLHRSSKAPLVVGRVVAMQLLFPLLPWNMQRGPFSLPPGQPPLNKEGPVANTIEHHGRTTGGVSSGQRFQLSRWQGATLEKATRTGTSRSSLHDKGLDLQSSPLVAQKFPQDLVQTPSPTNDSPDTPKLKSQLAPSLEGKGSPT